MILFSEFYPLPCMAHKTSDNHSMYSIRWWRAKTHRKAQKKNYNEKNEMYCNLTTYSLAWQRKAYLWINVIENASIVVPDTAIIIKFYNCTRNPFKDTAPYCKAGFINIWLRCGNQETPIAATHTPLTMAWHAKGQVAELIKPWEREKGETIENANNS